jgi:hypothetical protein
MTNYTILKLLRSESNKKADEMRFTPMHDLSPMLTTKCEISTEDASELIEFGVEPEIIPMGIGKCEASITGTFAKISHGDLVPASHVIPMTDLAPEIRNFYDSIRLFDNINNEDVQYAVQLSQNNNGGTTELGNGIWKIKKFTWDRKAQELGVYRFNMTLSYHWVNKLEQEITKGNTGSTKDQYCNFVIAVYDPTKPDDGWTENVIVQRMKIHKSLQVKSTAEFDMYVRVQNDLVIKIYKIGCKDVIFYGLTYKCEISSDGMFRVSCKEIMDLLFRNVVADPEGGFLSFLNPRVVIPAVYNGDDKRICDLLKDMLSIYYKPKNGFEFWKPGTGVDRTKCDKNPDGLGASVYLPGRDPVSLNSETGVKITTQVMSGMSIGTGITKFLYHQCGFYTWVNYETGFFEYGFLRDPITINISKEVIIKTTLMDSNQEDTSIDGVIVFEPNAEYAGYDGEIGPDKHIAIYQLNNSQNDLSLEAIAHRILTYNKIANKNSYKVVFPAGTIRFKEGDYFKGLGDQTLPRSESMEWREGNEANPLEDPSDSAWQIKEVTITNTETTVYVGTSYYSILDLYKTSLSRQRGGVPIPTKRNTVKCKEFVISGG